MTTEKITIDRARYDDMLAALRLLSSGARHLGQQLDMAQDPDFVGIGDGTASSVLDETHLENWNSPAMQALQRLEEAGLCRGRD